MPRLSAKSAWLVTWDGTSPPDDRVVAVLNHRLGRNRVREIVEQMYVILAGYGHAEKLTCAISAKSNPYPALLTNFERITCGHNPWLYARRVTNLSVQEGRLVWTEPPTEVEMRQRLRELGLLR
jgi:hypothetical protein